MVLLIYMLVICWWYSWPLCWITCFCWSSIHLWKQNKTQTNIIKKMRWGSRCLWVIATTLLSWLYHCIICVIKTHQLEYLPYNTPCVARALKTTSHVYVSVQGTKPPISGTTRSVILSLQQDSIHQKKLKKKNNIKTSKHRTPAKDKHKNKKQIKTKGITRDLSKQKKDTKKKTNINSKQLTTRHTKEKIHTHKTQQHKTKQNKRKKNKQTANSQHKIWYTYNVIITSIIINHSIYF